MPNAKANINNKIVTIKANSLTKKTKSQQKIYKFKENEMNIIETNLNKNFQTVARQAT